MLHWLATAPPSRKTRLLLSIPAIVLCSVAACDLQDVNDEDVLLVRQQIPESEDAWPLLVQAAEAIVPPRPDAGQPNPGAGRLVDDDMSIEELADLVAANEGALTLMNEAFERGRLSVPPDEQNLPSSFSLLDARRLRHLLQAGERVALASKDTGDATSYGIGHFRLGQLLASGKGLLINYLVAAAEFDSGVESVARLRRENLSLADRHRLLEALDSPPQDAWLQDTLRAEYSYWSLVIDDPALLGLEEPRQMAEESFLSSYFYQKNRTKQLFADFYRQMISSAESSCAEAKTPEIEQFDGKSWRAYLSPNAAGRITFNIGAPSMMGTLTTKCGVFSRLALTRAQLAADIYAAETGQKAPSLQALVPEYLDAVPMDGFDGQPIRYADGVVYSVGEDFADDGGDPEKDVAPFAEARP